MSTLTEQIGKYIELEKSGRTEFKIKFLGSGGHAAMPHKIKLLEIQE